MRLLWTLNMPITIHTSFPRRTDERDVYLMKYPKDPQGEDRPFDFLQRLARQGIYHCGAVEATQLIFTGVFDRFPKLQIFWAENNIGWIPYFYQQMDQTYKVNCHWAERLLGLPKLKKLPSEYLREHAHWGVFDDRSGSNCAIWSASTRSCGRPISRTSSRAGRNHWNW